MSTFHDKAVECRGCQIRHYNCAQATVVPFVEAAGLDEETAMRFAAGFGGGMKRASVCGAMVYEVVDLVEEILKEKGIKISE